MGNDISKSYSSNKGSDDMQKSNCNNNQISNFYHLPSSLQELNCCGNKITNVDHLPASLQILNCSGNKITNVDHLPTSLQKLGCKKYKCWIYYQINKPGKFSDSVLFPRYCDDSELKYMTDNSLLMPSKQNTPDASYLLNGINYPIYMNVDLLCNCYWQYIGYQTLKALQKKIRFLRELSAR